jgi:hypothetical protein
VDRVACLDERKSFLEIGIHRTLIDSSELPGLVAEKVLVNLIAELGRKAQKTRFLFVMR